MTLEKTFQKKQRNKKRNRAIEFFILIIIVPFIPLIFLIVLIFGVCWLFYGVWLCLQVRLQWYPKGKYLLFVYSNSLSWKEYIETNILPKINQTAIIINWSERSKWDWKKRPLEIAVFKHWTGVSRYFFKSKIKWDGEDFNPIAITFIPWWKSKVLRFWQPFKDFKHGKERALTQLEAQLFDIIAESLDRNRAIGDKKDQTLKLQNSP